MQTIKSLKIKQDGQFSEEYQLGIDEVVVSTEQPKDTSKLWINPDEGSATDPLASVAYSGNYEDLINKPINLSQFTNDADFITSTVDNLTNYYKKTDTYSQEEVNQLLGNLHTLDIQVIDGDFPEKPSTTTIYLKKKDTEQAQNVFDEYIYFESEWEKIGDTQIDLSNYLTIAAADAKYATIENLTTLDNSAVKISGNQSIEGTKTFSAFPVLPATDPASANEAASKGYVDKQMASAGKVVKATSKEEAIAQAAEHPNTLYY